MRWILQSNLFREEGYARLVNALKRRDLEYQEVQTFVDELRMGGFEVEAAPVVVLDPSVPTIVMGSYKLARIASEAGVWPGAFLRGLRYDEWGKGWAGHVLNPDAWTGKVRDACLPSGKAFDDVFCRPVADSKVFSGKVFTRAGFETWKMIAVELSDQLQANGDTEILLAKPVNLMYEVRTWVVNRKVATASYYRRGGQVFHSDMVDPAVVEFAEERANEWSPNPAYVMDVAMTEDGLKIVEANCLNAAGFYAGDMQKLVNALEEDDWS